MHKAGRDPLKTCSFNCSESCSFYKVWTQGEGVLFKYRFLNCLTEQTKILMLVCESFDATDFPLRSSGSDILWIPRTETKRREAAYSSYAPLIRNKLPEYCESAETICCSKLIKENVFVQNDFNTIQFKFEAQLSLIVPFYFSLKYLSMFSYNEQHSKMSCF